jgi:hypothetical protein
MASPTPPAIAAPYRAEHHGSWQAIDGYSDSPALGTAALGEAALAEVVAAVGAAFVAFHATCPETRA